MVRAKRIALAVFAALVFFSLVWWLAGGRKWADHFLTNLLVQRADQFIIPGARIPLAITVSQEKDEITVCNQGVASWNKTIVRINGEYLAQLKELRMGDCARIRKTSFLSPDWKHLPAPRDLQVTEVEVLSQVSGFGYAKEHVLPIASSK